MQERKVSQVYYVDEGLLQDLAIKSKSEFFASSLKFYQKVKDKNLSEISGKQIQWLQKLCDILDKKTSEGIKKRTSFEGPVITKKFTLFPKKTKNGWVWFTYFE